VSALAATAKSEVNPRLTLTWGKAALFFALGLWPALLILFNLRPVLTLAEQLHRYQPDVEFAGVGERFRAAAGAELGGISAVREAAGALAEKRTTPALFARWRGLVPGNAVLPYLEVAAVLSSTETDEPSARFESIRASLQAARQGPAFDWYTVAAMNAWRSALADTGARDDLNAKWALDWACDYQASAIRITCASLLNLADELLAASQSAPARTCLEAAVDFAERSLEGAVSVETALACAEQLDVALRRASLVSAAEGEWDESRRSSERADRVRRFSEILRLRRATAPYDPLCQMPVVREQPYRAVVSYLLASGLLVSGWGALLLVGLGGAVVAAAVAFRGGDGSRGAATVGRGWIDWFWAGAIAAGPSVGLAAAVLMVPIDLRAVLSLYWIQAAVVLVVVFSVSGVLTLGRRRASAGGSPPATSRVWQWWWVVVVAFGLLFLVRPWLPFGPDQATFDRSIRVPQAGARAQAIQAWALALGVLGVVARGGWCLISRFRSRKTALAHAKRPSAGIMGRAVVVLAMWGWLILGIMSMGAVRLYHRYDVRMQELTCRDLQDEVTAWMGPAWKRSFLSAPD
jgi:hypothetical protein